MKVEIKTNEQGKCEYFKIDGKEYGQGIYELNIKIKPLELPEIVIKAKSEEFIMDSNGGELYLGKYTPEKVGD